jgi:hypothetical protein
MPPIEQLPDEPRLDEIMAPLIAARPNPFPSERRDRRVKGGIVRAIGAVVGPTVRRLALGTE